MDKVGAKIINALETQGYLKTATLATQLGIGERTVRRRVHMLINSGLVKVIILTNPILLGYKYWARVGIKTKIGFLNDTIIHLTKHPSIYFLSESVGTFDLIAAASFKSIDQLAYFANIELPDIQGIQSAEVFPMVWPRKYFHFYWPLTVDMVGNPKNFDELNNQHHYELDEVDRKILAIITKEGHIRPAELKSQLSISETTVRKHVKKMSDSGVFKLAVEVNPEHTEYEFSGTIGINVHQASTQRVMDEIILEDPAVIFAAFCIGRFNIILTRRFHDITSLNQFINVDLPNIEGISSVEAFIHTKRHKYYMPLY